jgi:hypothetical protein
MVGLDFRGHTALHSLTLVCFTKRMGMAMSALAKAGTPNLARLGLGWSAEVCAIVRVTACALPSTPSVHRYPFPFPFPFPFSLVFPFPFSLVLAFSLREGALEAGMMSSDWSLPTLMAATSS